ncbi:related to Alpha-1,2 glucosyltransferase ALG10 [Sporisorium scitamineum]|uniref:Dol-P-Glc:Glc(2)Man(9)GlcNAc(2)-PP-Dol alpha-1,2-glucosyltransferase n=2 Tax=Sporisorium scitamineum TaxID=49012 RepID=A0A127ZAK7_9BASI|nr:related to Alpha-1,2 glucosyltransferase ALG10 [Sporisorium scitamineum]
MSSPRPSPLPIPLAQHIPTLIFIAVTVLTSTLISRVQPTPYIDEIFHIPQAQRYCSALSGSSLSSVRQAWQRLRSVEYDAKLTTPPGLYAISVGLAKVLPGWECGHVVWLRSTNLVLLLTLPVLVARIIRQNEEAAQPSTINPEASTSTSRQPHQPAPRPKKAISRNDVQQLQARAKLEQPPTPTTWQDDLPNIDPPTLTVSNDAPSAAAAPAALARAPKRKEATPYTMAVACTICFLPPLWFFGFLYYTDLASIWLVLATWTLYNDLNQHASLRTSAMSAVVSMWAVLVRQTNIVWVGFCAAQAILGQTGKLTNGESRGWIAEVRATLATAFGSKRREFWRVVATNVVPMLPMLVGSAWFIRWNGSIVLGDKTNHQAGLHLAQMGYFIAFASLFGLFPLLFSLSTTSTNPSGSNTIANALRTTIATLTHTTIGTPSSITTLAATLLLSYIAVDQYTLEHPFLLADNRHYTFYLWRTFHRSYTLSSTLPSLQPKYLAVPLYALALNAWNTALPPQPPLVRVVYWMATATTLVLTPLVEVRYFLMPYVVLRVLCQRKGKGGEGERRWWWLGAEVVVEVVVNAGAVELFAGRTFEWDRGAVDRLRGEGTTMRFIW